MPPNAERRGFWLAFAPLAALAVLPLWIGEFPPLADLPQHAAQISVLRHWSDPACDYANLYEIRWFDPYWLGYALAWALAWLVPVADAVRIVLALALVGIPLALRAPLRALGGDPAWALLCLPLAYGFPLDAGFYSFFVSVPCILALAGAGLRYAREPDLRHGLGLGLGCAALYLVHLLALAAAGLMLAAVAALATPAARDLPRRLWPLLLALPAPLAWWLLSPAGDRAQQAGAPYSWSVGRLLELPVLLTGVPGRAGATAALALALGSLALTRPALAREPWRWAPFAIALLLVLAGPNTFYFAPRFAVLLFPLLLCALDRRAPAARPAWRRVQVAGVTLLLLGFVVARFVALAAEGRGLDRVLAAAPAGERLLYLDYDRGSRHSPEAPFLHSGMRYALDRCGVAEKSFARNFQLPVQYRPGRATSLPRLIEYMPYRFRWDRHGGDAFDLYLIRSVGEPATTRIAGGPGRLTLLARAGRWWLFRNAARSAAAPPP